MGNLQDQKSRLMLSSSLAQNLTDRHWRWLQVGFILFAGLYLLLGLNYPLINVTETRAAEVAREILVTGNWTTLHLNFEPYYHKPPLFYWLCAASFSILGVNEFAARLIPALASWGSIVLTVWFGTRWFGAQVGLLSGGVLFLSAGFNGLSRLLVCDPLFSFFCTATSFAGYEAIRNATNPTRLNRGRGWMMICGLTCGLGFLTKGPVIGILCGVPFLYAVYILNRQRAFGWISVAWAVIVCGLVIVPWLIWTAAVDPHYLAEFLVLHNVQRFSGGFHEEPFWYFLPILIVAGHPWSSLTIPFLYRLWERRDFQGRSSPTFRYLLLTGCWCVFFFSLSRGKLPTYILPAAAPLSMTMAVFLYELFGSPATTRMHVYSRSVAPVLAMAGTFVAVLAYWFATPISWQPDYQTWGTIGISSAFLACVLAVGWLRPPKQQRWWIVCVGMVLSFLIWVNHCVLPNLGEATTCLGSVDSKHARNAVSQASPLIVVEKPFYDAMFYAQRKECLVYKQYDAIHLNVDLKRYSTLVLITPPSWDLESVLANVRPDQDSDRELFAPSLHNVKVDKLFSTSRYNLYRLERDVTQPIASRE